MFEARHVRFLGLVIIALTVASGSPPSGDSLVSPNGRRVAYVVTRTADQWLTIMLREHKKERDLLPGDMKGRLGSPGIRSVQLGAWLNDDELAFNYHCGTGCIAIYKVNTATDALTEIWTGGVDFGVFWSPRGDRALVVTHQGGLLMLDVNGKQIEVPGCTITDGKSSGSTYRFEQWRDDGIRVRVRKWDCRLGDDAGGQKLVWDGQQFAPLRNR